MQSEVNNLGKFPFSNETVEAFKSVMEGLGPPLKDATVETISKAFNDDKLYDKMIELLNMKKEIIDTQLKVVNAMFLYHHFGSDTFIVSNRIIGRDVVVKIESYNQSKDEVVLSDEKNRSRRFSIPKSSFEDIIVKRIETIK